MFSHAIFLWTHTQHSSKSELLSEEEEFADYFENEGKDEDNDDDDANADAQDQQLAIGSASGSLSHQPYVLYAVTQRPPGAAGANGGGADVARGRNPGQVLCPYIGFNVTAARPLCAPVASSKTGAFGVRFLLPVTVTRMLGADGA